MKINKAIILAAGSSERLGSPKALVELNGQTLVQLVCKKLRNANLEVIVVTRISLGKKIQEMIPDIRVVVNPSPELGRTGTIQCAIESIGIGPILITPVDRPGFSHETVSALSKCKTTTIPTYEGKGGHPIAITSEDCETILLADPDTPLRELINPDRMRVNDPHLHLNIDTENDVNQLLKVVKYL